MMAAPNPITHDAKYRSQVLGTRNDAMNKLKQSEFNVTWREMCANLGSTRQVTLTCISHTSEFCHWGLYCQCEILMLVYAQILLLNLVYALNYNVRLLSYIYFEHDNHIQNKVKGSCVICGRNNVYIIEL